MNINKRVNGCFIFKLYQILTNFIYIYLDLSQLYRTCLYVKNCFH